MKQLENIQFSNEDTTNMLLVFLTRGSWNSKPDSSSRRRLDGVLVIDSIGALFSFKGIGVFEPTD